MATSTVTWLFSELRANDWQVVSSTIPFSRNSAHNAIDRTNVPIPSATGTKFSTTVNLGWGLADDGTGQLRYLSGFALSKKQAEAQTGIKFWVRNEPNVNTGDGFGSTFPPPMTPADTGDNNITAPTMYSGVGQAIPLWPSTFDLGMVPLGITTSNVTTYRQETTSPAVCFGLDYTFNLYGSGSNTFDETNLLRLSWNEG